MNSWLFPSVVAALVSALALDLVYFYAWLERRERHILLWTLGWALYTLRFCFTLAMSIQGSHPALAAAELLSTVASAVFLFEGTCLFCQLSPNRRWRWLAGGVMTWTAAACFLGLPFMATTIPAFFFMGSIQVVNGMCFFKYLDASRSRVMAGAPMIIWGLHKFDYPFLRHVEWFAPWGFLLGALCAVMAAMGFLFASLERFSKEAREGERRYRRIVENAADAMFLSDEAGRLVDVNKAACQTLGYTREELLSMNVWDVDPNTSPEFNRSHWENFPLEGVETYETTHLRKDGTPLNVEIHLCLFEEFGKKYVLGLGRVITERKKDEEALRAEVARRKSLMEISYDGIAIFNEHHQIIEANKRFCDNLGYTREELAALHTWDFEVEMPESEIRKKFVDFLAMNTSFETRHRRKDGTLYDAEVSIGGAIIQGEPLLTTITRDISDRKRAEEALKVSEQRFRRLLEDVDMVAVRGYDVDRRVIFWNAASEKLYGYSKEEALGQKIEELIVPEPHREAFIRLRDKWMHDGVPIPPGEHELLRKDGSSVVVYASHVMQENASGGREMYCVDVELTEIKKAHDQLLAAKAAAESANMAKSEFLANMSHEIRTPLNGVMGMLQLMRMTGLGKEQDGYALAAFQSAQRLNRLLGDILDLSRIEAGHMEIRRQAFNLREALQDVEHLFELPSKQKGIALEFHVDATAPATLMGDGARLRQTLNNLVGNAVKFTEEGTVTVGVTRLPSLDPATVKLYFTVSDTGIGMPDDAIEFLFKPFSQAEKGYSRSFQGAGLGLSICRQLMKLMGGTICIETEVDLGTTMHVTLPFRATGPADVLPDHAIVATHPLPAKGLRVLLAEDDAANRLSTRRMLETLGCIVQSVENGRQALDSLRSDVFDVLLLDIQMPVMDGMEVVSAIRTNPDYASVSGIPILALTAYAMEDDRERFLTAGMNGCLSKPVEAHDLAVAVAAVAGRSESSGLRAN